MFIQVDEGNIIRCMATRYDNLHADKMHMKIYEVEPGEYRPGDRFEGIDEEEKEVTNELGELKVVAIKTLRFTPIPENYPQPTQDELNEQKIQQEMRAQAINTLIARGELPINYKEK